MLVFFTILQYVLFNGGMFIPLTLLFLRNKKRYLIKRKRIRHSLFITTLASTIVFLSLGIIIASIDSNYANLGYSAFKECGMVIFRSLIGFILLTFILATVVGLLYTYNYFNKPVKKKTSKIENTELATQKNVDDMTKKEICLFPHLYYEMFIFPKITGNNEYLISSKAYNEYITLQRFRKFQIMFEI